jgi:hypothetical protein
MHFLFLGADDDLAQTVALEAQGEFPTLELTPFY